MKLANRAFAKYLCMLTVIAAVMLCLCTFDFAQRAAGSARTQIGKIPTELSPFKRKRIEADQAAVSSIKYPELVPAVIDAAAANPLIYAYDETTDHLISFNVATPGTLVSDIPVVGLNAADGEFVITMDFRPSDGSLYGIVLDPTTGNERLVTINTATGQLTSVGANFIGLSGLFFGGDINPVTDTYREIDEAGDSRRISLTTGVTTNDTALAFAAGDVNAARRPDSSNIAFSNNTPGATQTTLYGIDSSVDSLVRIGSVGGSPVSPNSGQVFTVGPLGTDVVHFGGFDIQQGTGLAYAALKGPGGAVSSLYQINLGTGAATLIGPIGGAGDIIDGLTIPYSPNGGSSDLSITKTDNANTYTAGGTTTYTIVATNNGPDPVVGATLTDTMPASISSSSFTCVAAGGAACPAANGNGNIASSLDIPSGGTVTYTVTANIAAGVGGALTNTATIAAPAGVTDPTPANNSATDTDNPLTTNTDLSITTTDNRATYAAGGTNTYTIVATNAGPSAVTGATVTSTFTGAATSSTSFTCTGAGGATCPAANGNGNVNATVNLPAGGSLTYTVSATTAANASGNLVNTATITAPAGVTDTNPANNTAIDTDTFAAATTDLSITKTDNRATYSPGGSTVYTIVATNNGPDTAFGATVTDFYPASITGAGWTCTATAGGSCPNNQGFGNLSATVNIPSGGSVTFVVSATISQSAAGDLTNTATVTAGAGATDPTPGNNSATDTDTLQTTAGEVSISGRVVDPNGRGIRGARVTITDNHGVAKTVMTSSLGYYRFDDVASGANYVIGASSKSYRFASRPIQVTDSLADVNFVGQE